MRGVRRPGVPVSASAPHDDPWTVQEVADPATGHAEVEALFATIGAATGGTYPPHERLAALGSLAAWVWISPTAARWEARDGAGALLGTVQLQALADDRAAGRLDAALTAYWATIATAVAAACDRPVTLDELAVVERLAVAGAAHRSGIGTALLTAAVARAHARGLVPVLTVLAASRPAVALYRTRGGQELGRRRGLSGHDVLVFAFGAPADHDRAVWDGWPEPPGPDTVVG